MTRSTTLVLLLVAPLAIATAHTQVPPSDRFQVVSGSGYEGAIIPASLVPEWYKDPGVTSTWTPTAADVALTEARLVSYVEGFVKDRSQASQPVAPPYDPASLRELAGRLQACKRQYVGLTYGEHRRLLVNGIADLVRHNWRQQVVMVVDGGCGYWHFDFDLHDKRVVRFWCQGTP